MTETACLATQDGIDQFNRLFQRFRIDTDEASVREMIAGTPLEYIGQDISRVFLVDINGELLKTKEVCMVKIGKDRSTGPNRREALAYETAKDDLKSLIAPVTDRHDDFNWIVQAYSPIAVTDDQLKDLEKGLVKNGKVPPDVHKNSVMFLGGTARLAHFKDGLQDIENSHRTKREWLRLIGWKYEDG